jgi:hypothetical protein
MAGATARAQEPEPTLEFTLYGAECRVKLVESKCPDGEARPQNPQTFTLYPQSHRLRIAFANVDSRPTWVHECVIRDVDNWTCMYDDNSGVLGMIDHNYWSLPRPPRIIEGYHLKRVSCCSSHGPTVFVTKEQHELLVAEFGYREPSID